MAKLNPSKELGPASLTNPVSDLPEMSAIVEELGSLGDQIQALESRKTPLKERLMLNFRKFGIKAVESPNFLATRVYDDPTKPDAGTVSWTRKNLVDILGEKDVAHIEQMMREEMMIYLRDYIMVRAKSKNERPADAPRDVLGRAGEKE